MSDTETRKTGYRVEYAASGRAKCKGPKPCGGTALAKGELRFGSLVEFQGKTSYAWRHWGCVTSKVISNVKSQFPDVDQLDGYEELKEDDQEKLKKAWEVGKVADEDKPSGANNDDDDAEEKPKKKRAAPKKKQADADEDGGEKPKKRGRKAKDAADDDDAEEAKPKKTRTRKPKKAAEDEDDEPEEEMPKKVRKKPEPKPKAAPKKKASKKTADDEVDEDFGDEIEKVADDEHVESGQKRKRPVSQAAKPTSRTSKRSKPSSSKNKEVDDDDED